MNLFLLEKHRPCKSVPMRLAVPRFCTRLGLYEMKHTYLTGMFYYSVHKDLIEYIES